MRLRIDVADKRPVPQRAGGCRLREGFDAYGSYTAATPAVTTELIVLCCSCSCKICVDEFDFGKLPIPVVFASNTLPADITMKSG